MKVERQEKQYVINILNNGFYYDILTLTMFVNEVTKRTIYMVLTN